MKKCVLALFLLYGLNAYAMDYTFPDFTPESLAAFLEKEENLMKQDKQGMTLLHWAIPRDIAYLKMILAHKIDVDAQDSDGSTPLIMASARKDINYARLLLEKKADPNIQTKGGYTALHKAIVKENKELCELLVLHRADPHIKNNAGFSSYAFAELHCPALVPLFGEKQTKENATANRPQSYTCLIS